MVFVWLLHIAMRFRTPRAQTISVAVLLFSTAIQQCKSATVSDLVQQRHNAPPSSKRAELGYPSNQNSALMLSPCRPEKDGYFGGTNGDPSILQYAFEMESHLTGADISGALAAVREHVMDVTVATTFPVVCSFRELSSVLATTETKGVTGLKFGQEYNAIRKFTISFSFFIHARRPDT